MDTKPVDDSYDVIIIGSGIAGLISGALLAKNGKKVLIIEQHNKVGGYAQSFKRHNILFNSSVHFTGGWEQMDDPKKGVIYSTLDLLNATNECSFVPLEPFLRICTPESTIDVPSGIASFAETLRRLSPGEEKNIRKLLKNSITISNQIRMLPQQPNLFDYISMPFRFPHLCLNGNRSLKEVLDNTFTNNSVKQVLGLLSLCFGTPVSKVSFVFWTHLLQCFIEERAGYCIGTFQNFADAIARAFSNYGGTFALKTLVKKITTDNDRVTGIVIDNGRIISAANVISNADILTTYSKLLDPHKKTVPFLNRIRQMRPSTSAFSVFIETDFDVTKLNAAHVTIVLPKSDLSPFCNYDSKPEKHSFLVSIPSITDASAQHNGKHGITLATLYPHTLPLPDQERKLISDAMISKLCEIFPQLQGHIVYKENSTPKTYERYTLNQCGAMIGWEYTQDQVGFKRPPVESPLKGLYHAGHWTRPGGGMYGAVISGRYAAQKVLGYKDQSSFIRSFSKR
jgi:prolycopene isomerase